MVSGGLFSDVSAVCISGDSSSISLKLISSRPTSATSGSTKLLAGLTMVGISVPDSVNLSLSPSFEEDGTSLLSN